MGVLNVVSKVFREDEEAGSVLVEMVVYDYLTDLAKQYRPAFDAVIGPWALDRVQVAKRQLARGYVSKAIQGTYPDEEVQQVAQWLAGLERFLVAAVAPEPVGKAFEWWTFDNNRKQVSVNRDAMGRFSRSISQAPEGRSTVGLNSSDLHPEIRGYVDASGNIKPEALKGTEQEQAELVERIKFAQAQWQEAEKFIGELQRGLPKGVRDEAEATLWARGKGGLRPIRIPLKDVKNGKIPNLGTQRPDITETLSHVDINPGPDAGRETVRQIAALNMLGATGSEAAIGLAMTDRAKWNALASSLNVDPKSRESKLTRFFNQMSAGGGVLTGVPGAGQYGRFAQFVGEMGPEAEKVLGPYVQRAAYRYRGTETSPDKNLVRMFNGAEMGQVDALASGKFSREQEAAAAASLNGPRAAEKLGSRLMIDAVQRRQEGLSSDSLKMQVRADMAGADLAQTLPKDPIIARLSQKAGTILPSQGILINADGKIVSQAVGFADDHYLPFDLKNLSALRGGQYVRTRQAGGLTGEDVYSAVTMGARMVTVVSPSGVFTLEMSPDFRGARSMSDKARGMYDRYLKILDAVEGSGLYLEDIPAADKLKIQQDVKALRLDKDRTQELIDERLNEARENAQRLSPEEIEGIENDLLADKYNGKTRAALTGADARRFADELAEAVDVAQSTKSNKLRLNGQGYAVALQTLQQQYPYFIRRVGYETLNNFATNQGLQGVKGREFASDQGYVRPGGLKANSTKEGFYKPAGPREWKNNDTEPTSTGSGTSTSTAAFAAPAGSAENKPKSESVSDSVAPVNSPLQQRLSDRSGELSKMRDKAATDLAHEFGKIPAGLKMDPSRTPGNATTTVDALSGTNTEIMDWLVSQPDNVLKDAMADPQASLKLVAALSDREAVTSILNKRLSEGQGVEDFFQAGNKLGGASDYDNAVEWTVRTARLAADALLLQQPFSGSSTADSKSWRAPTVDPIVSGISDKDQLLAYASSEPEVWSMAVELATAGDDYDSLTGVAQKAQKKLESLDRLAEAKKRVTAALNDSSRAAPKASDFAADVAPSLGKPAGDVTLEDITNAEPNDLKKPILAAWQLAATGRALQFLGEGEVFPKESGQRWLVKKSQSRVRVLKANDPLSLAVQERVLKGIPFVPSRKPLTTS